MRTCAIQEPPENPPRRRSVENTIFNTLLKIVDAYPQRWYIPFMQAESVSSYRSILKEELAKKCERNARFSIRAFAKNLGLDPGALSRILSGKQIPSYKVSQQILSRLELAEKKEKEFFNSVAETQAKRGLQRVSPAFSQFKKMLRQKEFSTDLYRVIGDWYHLAILELTFVEGFQSDPIWIAQQLRISRVEAKLAIERLLELELLAVKDGQLFKTEVQLTTGSKILTTPAQRKHQRQYLEKSIASLEETPIEERSQSSMIMAIDPDRLEDAKKLIREFNKSMCQLLEGGERKRVYNFQMSLYPIQEKSK